MHYDTVMCMVVPDDVKTKDAQVNEYEIHYTVPGKKEVFVGSGKGSKESEAISDFLKYHKHENPTIVNVKFYKKVSDNKTIDKAIKNCDGVATFSFKQEIDFKGLDFTRVLKEKVANVTSNLQVMYNREGNSYSGSAVITNVTSFNMLVETLAFFKEWIVMPR